MYGDYHYGYPYELYNSAVNIPAVNPGNHRLAISSVSTSVETLGNVWDTDLGQDIPIMKVTDKNGFFFTTKMAVDSDGNYWAYDPEDICGNDSLSNAVFNGVWYGVVTDQNGNPVVQKDTDPVPGFYVSPTTLSDCNKPEEDPTRYVNSQRIPYFVLPVFGNSDNFFGAVPGDFGVVINRRNGKMAYAIFADTYPVTGNIPSRIGEGSMALADALGINNNPKYGGVFERVILYIAFPGTGDGPCRLRTIEEIVENGKMNFEAWGGMEQVNALQRYM